VSLEPFAVDAYDLVFVPAATGASSINGRLYVAAAEGNQAFAYDLGTTMADASRSRWLRSTSRCVCSAEGLICRARRPL